MTDQSLRVIEDLLEAETVVEAIEEFIAAETEERLADLRAAVRAGTYGRAHEIEGELALLEQLPDLLKKRAAKSVRYRA